MKTSILITACAAMALSCSAAAHEHAAEPKFSQQKLSDNLYMLTGKGGNLALSTGTDGLLLIDDDYTDMAEKTRAAIASISSEPVKFVINTHWHFDHTGGNQMLGESGTIIVAHDNVRQRLMDGGVIKAFNAKIEPAQKPALPVMTFSSNVSFHWNDDTISVDHPETSAHTDGDAVVYFKNDNVVHTGDLYFNSIYPFIDASSGGSMLGVIAAVTDVLAKIDDDTRVIPGHGALSNKAELTAYRDMLQNVYARILKMKSAGKTLQQVVDSKPTADFDDEWNEGFLKADNWVGIIYSAI